MRLSAPPMPDLLPAVDLPKAKAMTTIRLHVDVTVPNRHPDDWEAIAQRLFEALADDPDDTFPEIETVDSFGWEQLP